LEFALPLLLIMFTITRAVLASWLMIALMKKTVAQWREKMAIPRWLRVNCVLSGVFIMAGSWFVYKPLLTKTNLILIVNHSSQLVKNPLVQSWEKITIPRRLQVNSI
jgi:hypothetical protein